LCSGGVDGPVQVQGEILEITGPQAVTAADIAAALTQATGRRVRHQPTDDDEHAQALIAQGIPEPYAHAWSSSGISIRDGWFDITTHTVQRLTGRPATTIEDYFATHREQLIG
jgi:NAD(P)H dehydrogenase (quinone)